jgi:hypothetical protein
MRGCFALLICATVFSLVAPVEAHLPEYSPFPPAARPKQFPVRELAELRHIVGPEGSELHLAEKDRTRESRNPILRITWPRGKNGDEGIALSILTWDQKRDAGPFHVSSNTVTPSGYSGDLNRDGVIDYVLTIFAGAVGAIGGGVADVVFVISDAGRAYGVFMTTTLYPSTNDFVDLRGDGRFEFVQTGFVTTEPIRGKDGRSHNYWLYRLLKLEGSSLVLEDSVNDGFPKWILYTFRANHTDTDQLSEAQKRELLGPGPHCLISTPEKPCPGFFRD